jgi:solute:Na+ symporter, SSS family
VELKAFDLAVFLAFVALVVGVSIYKSRRERTSEDYFLASRGLNWWLIGISLIAANISTEQFVGMSGQAAGNVGLAIASYEWMAAITLVLVGLFFLPKFLRAGIFTIPEYLEYRYNAAARAIMALFMMLIYVGVTLPAVIYSGGLTIQTIFGDVANHAHLVRAVWGIGVIAMIYVVAGGLKACAWADLFQGWALIIGGAIVLGFALHASGGISKALETNADKLHMFLPAGHPVLPWTALVVALWIPNFYYWGLNQYICQRTLAARNLKQGQLGVIYAAFLKLLIPFVIVMPGILAYELYADQMTGQSKTDAAYPLLIKHLIPDGLRGFMFAAIGGAVVSTLAAMLNSASTIFTMDLFKRHLSPGASQAALVWTGRASTVLFVLLGCFIAPFLGTFEGIFNYIQEFQGYIEPGILGAFAFGMIFRRTPPAAAVAALVLSPVFYLGLHLLSLYHVYEIAFLNRIAIATGAVVLVMALITFARPLEAPRALPVREGMDMTHHWSVYGLGFVVIVLTVSLYIIFR